MMYLMLFESDYSALPDDLAKRKEIWTATVNRFKEEIKNGKVTAMGISPAGGTGFILANQSAQEILAKRMTGVSWVKMQVLPMLSLDEVEEVVKGL